MKIEEKYFGRKERERDGILDKGKGRLNVVMGEVGKEKEVGFLFLLAGWIGVQDYQSCSFDLSQYFSGERSAVAHGMIRVRLPFKQQ